MINATYEPQPLLPCPFCGGPAIVDESSFMGFGKEYDIHCSMCKAMLGDRYTDLKTATARWNHRAK